MYIAQYSQTVSLELTSEKGQILLKMPLRLVIVLFPCLKLGDEMKKV